MRKCSKCLIEKDQSEFKKDKRCPTGYAGVCKACHNEDNKIHPISPDKREVISKRYYEKNKQVRNAKALKYKRDNPLWIREWRNNYQKKRREEDPLFKLSQNLRNRIRLAMKRTSIAERGKLSEIVGCKIIDLKIHLEDQFQDGMNWNNYGEWHIDHIIPLIKAKNTEELNSLCHFTNLQPLWAFQNISKGCN